MWIVMGLAALMIAFVVDDRLDEVCFYLASLICFATAAILSKIEASR